MPKKKRPPAKRQDLMSQMTASANAAYKQLVFKAKKYGLDIKDKTGGELKEAIQKYEKDHLLDAKQQARENAEAQLREKK